MCKDKRRRGYVSRDQGAENALIHEHDAHNVPGSEDRSDLWCLKKFHNIDNFF